MNLTAHTLVDQMQFTELEINARKSLLGFSGRDARLLADWMPRIEGRIGGIVERFYEHQISIDEIALLIGDADTLNRLKVTLARYVRDLFSGCYDADYVNNRLRIGVVHKRIGVEPKHYLASLLLLERMIAESIVESAADAGHAAEVTRALSKLMQFDTTLVFDSYIQTVLAELELARERAESDARRMEEQVRERTRELEELAQRDPLTGLYNRRACFERLRGILAQARRAAKPVALMYVDVDGLGRYNNTAGHIRGDDILRDVGAAMLQAAREEDVPSRLSGDEFCVVLPDCDLAGARLSAQRLCESFAARRDDVTLSIGLAQTGPPDYMDGHELLHSADEQMYIAKQSAGFQVVG